MFKGDLASVYVHSYTGSEGRSGLTGDIAEAAMLSILSRGARRGSRKDADLGHQSFQRAQLPIPG